mgnify:CR=1 FL=1
MSKIEAKDVVSGKQNLVEEWLDRSDNKELQSKIVNNLKSGNYREGDNLTRIDDTVESNVVQISNRLHNDEEGYSEFEGAMSNFMTVMMTEKYREKAFSYNKNILNGLLNDLNIMADTLETKDIGPVSKTEKLKSLVGK